MLGAALTQDVPGRLSGNSRQLPALPCASSVALQPHVPGSSRTPAHRLPRALPLNESQLPAPSERRWGRNQPRVLAAGPCAEHLGPAMPWGRGPLTALLPPRCPAPSPGHANGESSAERLAARFQDAVRTREESRGSLRSSYSSPASLSPRPRSPGSPGPGAAGSRSPPPGAPEDPCPPGLPQERGRRSSSPGPVLPPPNRPPSPGLWAPPSPWAPAGRASPSRDSPGSEPAARRFEGDSEVFKMLQENRELRAAPRQSSTFRLLQEALEDGGAASPAAPFPSRLSPGARKPGAAAAPPQLHACEKCGGTIATQAVRIRDGRYRHPSCYACSDCGLSLKMRGHFWVGDELYCEKHARLRYCGPPGGPAAPRAPPS